MRKSNEIRGDLSKGSVAIKKKKIGLKTLESKLNTVFSQYIRLRDSEDKINGTCVTCGRIKPLKELHNGHYVERNLKPTKFDERNCHTQCRYCNTYLEGHKAAYTLYLISTYGFDIIEELDRQSRMPFKPTVELYEKLIKYYTEAVAELDVYNIFKKSKGGVECLEEEL